MLVLSEQASKELKEIASAHATAAENGTHHSWRWYNQGKADGVNMVLNMMSEVDDDDYHDSRDPANVFAELKVGQITHTIQVKESNINAVVGTLIDNKYRVVAKAILDGISEPTWTIEYWKE